MLSVERAPVRDSKGKVGDGVTDGAPDVDETDARLEESFGVSAEVTMYATDTCIERLVDVDTFLYGDSQWKIGPNGYNTYDRTTHRLILDDFVGIGPTPGKENR